MKNDQTIGQEAEAILQHPLYPVLMAAINQAMYGKGQRHGGASVPFRDQPIFHYAKLHGRGFLTGQAAKKLEEAASTRDGEPFIQEALGAIVYLGAAIMREQDIMRREKAEAAEQDHTPEEKARQDRLMQTPSPWEPGAIIRCTCGRRTPNPLQHESSCPVFVNAMQGQGAAKQAPSVAAGGGYLARSGLGRGEQDRPFPRDMCNCAGSDSYGHAPWCCRSNRALDRQPPVVNACSGRDVRPERNGNQGPVRVADAEAPPAPGPEPVTKPREYADCLTCVHRAVFWDDEPCNRCSRNTRAVGPTADNWTALAQTEG